MSDTQTIEDWEKQKGWFVKDADPKDKLTEEDFDSIPMGEKIGVNYDDRVKFLTANGYSVTRENLVDPNLSAKATD